MIDPTLTLKIANLVTAATAITIKDAETIRAAGVLGPDILTNLENLQKSIQAIDQDLLDEYATARKEAGLPEV